MWNPYLSGFFCYVWIRPKTQVWSLPCFLSLSVNKSITALVEFCSKYESWVHATSSKDRQPSPKVKQPILVQIWDCRKNYTAGILGKKIYTFKWRNLLLLSDNHFQRNPQALQILSPHVFIVDGYTVFAHTSLRVIKYWKPWKLQRMSRKL